jgi:UDP:flavonoid glycosyltransferase YjiC (YdhE family)
MRILFFAEAVTLAHLARPAALVSALARVPDQSHELALALPLSHAKFVSGIGVRQFNIESMSSERFIAALSAGRPVCDRQLLTRQVQEDLRVFQEFQPDLVVGDFRLSLSISARMAKLPFTMISNAYWSPYSSTGYPMPVLPITKALPLPLARLLYGLGQRPAMFLHTQAFNAVRKQFGLASLGQDLKRIYTDADHVLFADDPRLYGSAGSPGNHHYIGPLTWAPPVPDPPWWDDPIKEQSTMYVNLGSSGSQPSTVMNVVTALSTLPCAVLLATAGALLLASLPANVRSAQFLDGSRASARARLIVCNGGSMACQQALMAGRPILGIASNMDQFLNMAPIANAGAGICLRADRLSPSILRESVTRLLMEPAWTAAAEALGVQLRQHDPALAFQKLLPTLVKEGLQISVADVLGRRVT